MPDLLLLAGAIVPFRVARGQPVLVKVDKAAIREGSREDGGKARSLSLLSLGAMARPP